MTGLELLREEMLKRGLNKQQVESKAVAVILDILANTGDRYTKMQQEEAQATALYRKMMEGYQDADAMLRVRRRELQAVNEEIKRAREYRAECEAYINKFKESLTKCETGEGRDAMRAAQMFVNSVTVDTKYDNTAFIIGLAAILSGAKIEPITELKKINKRLQYPG